ncbi:MAG: hypothetical protein ABW250_22580 [Pyrinomonadaceae bacterium]
MPNLLFTLWMLLFPLVAATCRYVNEGKLGRRYDAAGRALDALFDVVAWLAVGYLLYGS